jgi:peptidoglycan/xylan/chitin deacetylase (PgdA/CDA1 family)
VRPPGPTVRLLAVVAVIITAIVGGSYALGRATGSSPAPTAMVNKRTAAPTPADESPATAAGGPGTVQQSKRLASVQQAAPAMVNPIVGPGRPPLSAERKGPYGARMTTGNHEIALTFDDGPDPTWTPQVLSLLRRYHVKATFCLIGRSARQFPQLVRAIVADGHTLCNHTWDHDVTLGLRSRDYIRANMQRASDAIHEAAPAAKISYYRQPGGIWTSSVVAVATQLGMSSLHWAVDPRDWLRPAAGSIFATVTGATHRGAIVLMHDAGGDRSHTIAALRSILPNLTRRFQLEALPPGIDPPVLHGRELM